MEPLLLPASPYRGLRAFRYIDQEIFAGRSLEVEKIYKLLLQFRGVMVFGQSGTGKSSLVNAGLIPLLFNNSFVPEIIRLNPDSNGTFVVSRIVKDEHEQTYFTSTFEDFIDKGNVENDKINVSFDDFEKKIESLTVSQQATFSSVKNVKSQGNNIRVLIFDQFEELITFFEESAPAENIKSHSLDLPEKVKLQEKIIDLIKRCYYRDDLYVKLIFVFREDYLAKFGKLFNVIPDLKDHYLRIKPLPVSTLSEIIHRPFDTPQKKSHFKYPFSERFIESIKNKIEAHSPNGTLELTEVQIICLQVYNAGSETARSQILEQPVEKILENFYLDLLNNLNSNERLVAIDILSLLVLNEKSRNIYHEDAIMDDLKKNYSVGLVKNVLNKLENEISIIRREMRLGANYYEIVSEAIIPYINRKKIEKRIILQNRKERRLAFGLLFALLAIIGWLWYSNYTSQTLKLKEHLKITERSWYQKIPEDSLRDIAINTLAKYDTAGKDYKQYRTIFAILAESYYYSSLNQYNNAFSIAYVAKKIMESKKEFESIQQKFNRRINEFLLPYKTVSFYASASNPVMVQGVGGKFFLISSDNVVTVKDAFDDNYTYIIDRFSYRKNPGYRFNYDTTADGNRVRFSLQNKPSIVIAKYGGEHIYILYNSNKCYFFNAGMKILDSLKKNYNDILAILPYKQNRFMLLHDNCKYENFSLDNVSASRTIEPLFPEKSNSLYATQVMTYSNEKYFTISFYSGSSYKMEQFNIDSTGVPINRQTPDKYERLNEVNKEGMRLISGENNSYKIRYERDVSPDIQKAASVFLLADTNLVLSYGYDKIRIRKIKYLQSSIEFPQLDSIEQLSVNITPWIFSKRENIIIRENQSYILYNLNSKKKNYLFVNQLGNTKYNYNNQMEDGRPEQLFVNDSIFVILSGNTLNFYNLKNINSESQSNKYNDVAVNKVFSILKFNDAMDNLELYQLLEEKFKWKFQEESMERVFSSGDYDSCIRLAAKLREDVQNDEHKTYLYKYLYDSYFNMYSSLSSTKENLEKQLYYRRQTARYADTLLSITHDTSEYFFKYVNSLGSLSWLMIINNQYKAALDTANLAIHLDKENLHQWINTNLALAYLFNDSLPQALNVYRTWKNRFFNDDEKKASVRFMEDITDFKSQYNIDIPYKDKVIKELNSK